MVTKTVFGDHEIDDGGFGLNFGWVMGVGEFCVEEESEVGVEGKVITCEFEDYVLSSFDDLSGDNGHNNGINGFVHIFEHGGVTVLDTVFEFFVGIFLSES